MTAVRRREFRDGVAPVRTRAVDARVQVQVHASGRVRLTVTEVGARQAEHTAAAVAGDAERRAMIRALGGIPADEVGGEAGPGGEADRCWYCGDPVDPGATAYFKDPGRQVMHGTCPRDLP